jgi:hypothetical protein
MNRGVGRSARGMLLASIPVLLAFVTAVVLQAADAKPRTPEDPGERLVLRLNDLPPGYYPLDFSEGAELELTCESINPFKSTRALNRFVRRFSPQGCMGLYLRAYRVPGEAPTSPVIGTGALDAGSLEAAESGFAVARDMLDALVENEKLEEVAPATTVGDATRLFHWKRVPRLFRNGHLGSFLVWRSGEVLAAVFAAAGSLEVSDGIVTELAVRQQAHIQDPTPYRRSERNTSEVGLDDPALTFPVYWLGRTFRPGHGLPVARLRWGGAVSRFEALPGQRLRLDYDRRLHLESWTAAGWKRFLATHRGRELLGAHCADRTEVPLDHGRATIFAAYRHDSRTCVDRPPDRYFAVAHIDGIVVAVDFATCRGCQPLPSSPFDSPRGMRAVVRALVLRPRPVY